MNVLFDETMEFITPSFCAGARQSIAEIRAPSIRGELRWWFRSLGGSPADEQEVFGGIAGDTGTSSAVVVRVSMLPKSKEESREIPGNHKFFTMSRKGDEAMIPAGRCFRLRILLRRKVETGLLKRAVEMMTMFGAVGLRSNRGCGAVQHTKYPEKAEVEVLLEELRSAGFFCYERTPGRTGRDALEFLEETLKRFRDDKAIRKNGHNALGFVEKNTRHASCLRMRPVALKDGSYLPVLLYTEAAMGEGVEGIADELAGWFEKS